MDHGFRWDALVLFDPPLIPTPGHRAHEVAHTFEIGLSEWAAGRPDRFAHPMELATGFARSKSLAGWVEGDLVATTPDLITLLDANTGGPVTTDMVKYGLSVHVLGLPCDPIWRSDEAIGLVGPRYFGIDADYQPL